MTLNKDHLFVKMFYFSEWMKSEFHFNWWYKDTTPRHTNLCYFMRSILLYLPFMFFMQALGWFLPVAALLICPVYLFGWGYWVQPAIVISIIAIAVAIIFVMFLAKDRLGEWLTARDRKRQVRKWNRIDAGIIDPPSTLEVLGQYVHSVHRGICPLIDIEDDK